jgi:hypothetical protein
MVTIDDVLLHRLAELELADRERKLAVLVEQRVAAELAKRAEAEQQAQQVGEDLRRSQMTPGQKSRYIRQFGKLAYDQLPWS